MLSMWANETLLAWPSNISTIHIVTKRDKDKMLIWTSSTIFIADTTKFRMGQIMERCDHKNIKLYSIKNYSVLWFFTDTDTSGGAINELFYINMERTSTENKTHKKKYSSKHTIVWLNEILSDEIIYVSLVLQYFRLHHV